MNLNEHFIKGESVPLDSKSKNRRRSSVKKDILMKIGRLHSIQEEGDHLLASPSKLNEESKLFHVYDL